MSEIWEQHRPFVIAVLVWLGGSLLFYLAVYLPFSGPVAALDAGPGGGAVTANALAAHYERDGRGVQGAAVFHEAKRAVEAERAGLDAALEKARADLELRPGPGFAIKRTGVERANEYMDVRGRVASKLREEANRANVKIPHELDPRPGGKGKDLPGEGQVDELLFKLAMTGRIVRAAIAARVRRVVSIVHKGGAPRGAPLSQRVVSVRLEGELAQLLCFIKECSTPPREQEKAGGGTGRG